MKGTIKKVIRERGFGFISAEDGSEVFFHHTALQDINFETLAEDDSVEFDVEKGYRGPRAVNVKVIRA